MSGPLRRSAPSNNRRPNPKARQPHGWSCIAVVFGATVLVSATGCERRKTKLEEMNLTPEEARRILAEISAKQHESQPPEAPGARLPAKRAPTVSSTDASTAVPETSEEVAQAFEPEAVQGRWVVDGLVDVGPAAPSSASRQGVVLINGENELFVAKLGAVSASSSPQPTPISPLEGDHGRFALGRGPSFADGKAFWVTSHFLLSRPLKPPYGPLEILSQDARVGTRTAALPKHENQSGGSRPTWVAYIALPTVKNGPLRAKLWYGEEHEAILTDPSASSLSVELVEHGESVYAMTLEARMGQSNVHARQIVPGLPPKVGEDRVVWVGGGSNPTTELRVAPGNGRADNLLGLLPLEQDISHFGLAMLSFDKLEPGGSTLERWTGYANGINPAPVAAQTICNKTVALFARPSAAEPGSPQELVFAEVWSGVARSTVVLSRSKAFYDVSLAPVKHGALVSYVADHRTWARTVRCTAAKQ